MFKCKICGKKFTEVTTLYNHIESKHKEMIPKDMTVQQYYYYMKTGKMNGNCVMCKQPTGWNQNTGKYNRFCGNPKCKDEYVKIMKGRMVAKYGKTHLLNDPDKQREMLAHRSISGVYTWSDNKHESTYTGSYELDFLKTLDGFFNWDPEDISMPSPHTYTYKYEGEDKFYIPDVFIHSLDLEIEIKDGGDNPNNHHKIQDVDKEKERLKDEVMCSQKAFHYIKITNKNYENFFRFLKEIKKEFEKYGDEKKIPRIFKIEDIKGTNIKPVKESLESVGENYLFDQEDIYLNIDKFERGEKHILFITGHSGSGKSTLGKSLAKKYNAEYVELDYLTAIDHKPTIKNTIFEEYVKEKGLENFSPRDVSEDEYATFVYKFIEWLMYERTQRKMIVEGIQIFCVGNPNVIKDYPIIIKNVSAINSLIRARKRDYNNNWIGFIKNLPKEVYWRLDDEKYFKKFRKGVMENVEVIEEGLLSKLKDKIIKPKDPFNMSTKELKAKVDDAKKAYQKATTDGTFDMNEPHDVYRYSAILLNERNRVKNVIDVMENDKSCDAEKLWIMKHYHDWLQGFENQIIHNMVNYIKKDIAESKSKLSKSFNNCKEPSQYHEFITAVTYLIRYYRDLAKLVNIPEVDAHCKWLESMHKKACDKAGIGDGPLVFESNTEMWDDLEKGLKKFDKFTNVKYRERDAFLSLRYDLVKNDPKELQSYLSKLIKAARFEDDLWYVQQMAKKADDYYIKRLRKHPEMKDVYGLYYDWLKDGGIDKEIKERHKHGIKLIESFEAVEEKFEPDKLLVWIDKPIQKLKGGNIKLFHGSLIDIKGKNMEPICFNVGATKYSDPRWSTYFWDNKEDAMDWAIVWAVSEYHKETMMMGHNGKNLIGIPEGMTEKEFGLGLIEKMKGFKFYVYECEANIKDLEIGSCPSIREYTVSKSVPIIKKYEYELNKEMLRRFFTFVPMSEIMELKKNRQTVKNLKLHRGVLLNNILDNTRDSYRGIMRTDLQNGNIKVGDNLSGYKDSINRHVKLDTYGLKESYIIDRMEESSISIPQMSYYLQNQYEEDMRDYLNTYKKYYNLMLKEQPAAVKHINEDIRQCLIVIDGLAAKGVENNLVQFAKDDLGEIVKASKKGKPVKVYESIANEIIECKLVYNNPNSNQIFSLRDKDSKLIIENSYVIQRDKIGTSCSVTPYYKDIKEENILEFQLIINEGVNLTDLDNKAASGITISSLYNFNDRQNIFIREACMRLFGKYPDEIKFK